MQLGILKCMVTEGNRQPILAHGCYVLLCESFKNQFKRGPTMQWTYHLLNW